MSTKGLEPILVPKTNTPKIMLVRSSWARPTTAMVPCSHERAPRTKNHPRTMCQNIQMMKLPSWPSHRALKTYSMGRSLEECRHT